METERSFSTFDDHTSVLRFALRLDGRCASLDRGAQVRMLLKDSSLRLSLNRDALVKNRPTVRTPRPEQVRP